VKERKRPTNMAEMIPSSIRLPEDAKKLIKRTAKTVKMSVPETHRQAVMLGCPELVTRLKKKQ
jgi:hypothetical protein